ncbi:MAG: 50S ribosomal protein L15 [Bacteroidales bacterium]|jgi:large subunit ribosomal protein L15|nr:50S ribosomal protein L15 [Bacteroidales bacterium]
MELHTLKPAKGSIKNRKVIGRGQGTGHGGTSTRGHKGAKSRSGYSRKVGFEGGQMPLQRRVPKFGFKNINRVEYKAINLRDIQALVDAKKITDFDIDVFLENGFANSNAKIKILANGELTSKITVKAHAFSQKAVEVITALGGSAEKI